MEKREVVRQIHLKPGITVAELVDLFGKTGAYNAGALYRATNIFERMIRDRAAIRFFGLAGAMVPAGMGGIVADLIEQGHIDVLVSTGANCVHDIIEAIGCQHFHGPSISSDIELRRQAINRIYDIYLPDQAFEKFEGFIQEVLGEIASQQILTISDLLKTLGHHLKTGILATAAQKNVPVFSPAFQDSVLGLQFWLHSQTLHQMIDACGDMRDLLNRCYTAERAGALFVGGGVPKNYILQTMLLTPKGFDYAVQLTGDRPDLGGLSGATLDEARSWGKVSETAEVATVYGDATITLPLLVATVLERIAHG